MNEKLVEPFMKWLKAFEASYDQGKVAVYKTPSEVEAQIATTPAEGLRGLGGETRAASISQRPRRCRKRAS